MVSPQTPWPGAMPLDPAGGTAPDPHHLHPNTCYSHQTQGVWIKPWRPPKEMHKITLYSQCYWRHILGQRVVYISAISVVCNSWGICSLCSESNNATSPHCSTVPNITWPTTSWRVLGTIDREFNAVTAPSLLPGLLSCKLSKHRTISKEVSDSSYAYSTTVSIVLLSSLSHDAHEHRRQVIR